MRQNTEADFSRSSLMFDLAHASLRTWISVDRMTAIDRPTKYQYNGDLFQETTALKANAQSISS